MSFIKLLKTTSARITLDDRWLVWNKDNDIWVVYCRPLYAKKTRVLYSGNNMDTAIAYLEDYFNTIPLDERGSKD